MSAQTSTQNGSGRVMWLSVLVCVFATGLGWTFWLRGQSILRGDLRDRLESTASTAAECIALSQRIFSPFALILVVLAGLLIAGLIQWDAARRRMLADAFLSDERSGLLQLTLHRLGTPLTIFKWSLESLADCAHGKNCPTEDVENHIRQMRSGIQSMDTIIKQLLEVERVEEGKVPNDPKPTPVCPLIGEVLEELSADLAAKDQSVCLTSCVQETANADPEILRGILRELLHNASVYSPQGSVITVTSGKRRNHIALSVTDAGCGVPASERHRIFQKFGRASNAHLYDPNGAGLGLYIARNVIETAGGEIWMETEEGKGTTVTFTVPAAQ